MSDRDLYIGAGGRAVYARSETAELDKAVDLIENGQTAKGLAVLRRLRKQVGFGAHKNPPLVVFGNPPMGVKPGPGFFRGGSVVGQMSREVHAVLYRHLEDGKPYRHDFEHPTSMYAIERAGQRDVLITSPDGYAIWNDY